MCPRTLASPNAATGPVPTGPAGFIPPFVLLSNILSNISFSIQNCNSLNVSTSCPKQVKKIKAILDLDTDVIFLSDLRFNKNPNISDVEKTFLSGSSKRYKLIFNSTKSSRGVGILISSNVPYEINNTFKDEHENILGMNVKISGQNVNLVSIYGPNRDEPVFFRDVNRFLSLDPDCPCVLGGDWNATYSTEPSADNIDIFRMVRPPSIYRSEGISDLCTSFNLSDPFRILYPDTRDFTFRPRTGRLNRSRLDFFLISNNLIDCLSTCDIKLALCTELFDHKSVTLHLNKPDFKPNRSINLATLTHPRIRETIMAATVDCYITHADPTRHPGLGEGAAEIGHFYSLLRDINDLDFEIELSGPEGRDAHRREPSCCCD